MLSYVAAHMLSYVAAPASVRCTKGGRTNASLAQQVLVRHARPAASEKILKVPHTCSPSPGADVGGVSPVPAKMWEA